ncbi:MAG: hypothetical protein ABFS32_13820, partial [Bacteroidota bacterium]
HYVKGLELINNGRGVRAALEEFTRATQLDSTHSQSWLQVIMMKSWHIFARFDSANRFLPEIEQHIDYLEKDHSQWVIDMARGIYQFQALGNYEEGYRNFIKVIEHAPDTELAHLNLALYYLFILDIQQAFKHQSRAVQLNPQSAINWSVLSGIFGINGDYENQLTAYHKALELGFDSTAYDALPDMYYDAGLPYDSIPDKYRLPNSKITRKKRAYNTNDPSHVIKAIKDIPLDSIAGRDNYTRLEHYQDMAHAYKALYKDDSARYYANLCVQESKDNERDEWLRVYTCYCILGEINKMNELFAKYFPIDTEDIANLAVQQLAHIDWLIDSEKYEEATSTLIEFNKDYPTWGDYSVFTRYYFDRIKKEHPPFAEALKTLQLPPPLLEKNELKRLKY